MKAYNIVNCILILIIIISIICFYNMGERFRFRRRRGMFLEQACGKYDCNTQDGAMKAVQECKNVRDRIPGMKRQCDMGYEGCMDSCDIQDVNPYILLGEQGRMSAIKCKQPEELGIDYEGNIYCKNAYDNWVMKKTKKQIDAEEEAKKAAEEEAKKKAEEEEAKKAEEEKTVKPTETTTSMPIPEAPVVSGTGLKQEKFYYLN